MTRTTLTEAAAGAPTATDTPGRINVGLITPGWGSSGYYSQDVLEAAATAKVWPKGTHVYLDHPSESEQYDRPERSVRDLAAITTEDAAWDGSGLSAEAKVIGPYRELVTDPTFIEAVGMSIRSTAETEVGEAEGRKGVLVTKLVEGLSVDLVTKAGRGGRVLAVLESARAKLREAAPNATDPTNIPAHLVAEARNVGQWIESRLHLNLTQLGDDMFGDGRLSREERIALSGAVGDGLTAFTASLEQSAPQLYTRDLYDEPDATVTVTSTESGTNVPAPAGQPHPTPHVQEDTMGTIQVDEALHASVTEAAGRVPTLEAERDTAVNALAAHQARETARPVVAQRVAESTLPARRQARIVEAILAGVTPDAHDPAVVTAATEAAITDAEADMAEIAEALGVGKVRGFGSPSTSTGEVSEADYRAAMFPTEQKGA